MGVQWEFGFSRYKLVYTRWTNNKVLLYNSENYIQYPLIFHNGEEFEKECIYMYNSISLSSSRNEPNIVNHLYFDF